MAGKLPGRALDPTTTITINNISFGDNVAVNSSVVVLGNSTVNTVVNSTAVVTPSVNVGSNVFVNTSTIHLGNSTVNTVIHTTGFTGNGAGLHSVNAAALEGNTVANILTSANTAANTLASAAFTNAASRADSAYSNAASYADTKAGQAFTNAVSYAASNTYVNNTFLPLAGGTLTGNLTVNATANIVSNLSANNVTFRGDVQIDGNLVVSGTSVTLNAASLAIEDNMIYLNNGSQVTHPDLGFAGNYNDGSYKHAGFFRDATDGVWKVYDGYTPEPDASAYIDTSNASFRIADFTANVVTAASINVVSGALTTIAAGNTTITGFANVIGVSNTDGLRVVRNAGVTSQYIELNTNASAAYVTFNSSASNPKDVYYDIPPANNTSDIFHMFRVSALDKLKVNTSVVTVNAQLSAGNTTITGLANVSGNVTVSGSYLFVGQDVRSNGQIRATGWYNTPSSSRDGPAIEIGISTHGYILSYDRDTSAYGRMYFNANSFYIQTQGTQDGTYIGNSGSTHAYFASNGNVGIGNTSPIDRLVISDTNTIIVRPNFAGTTGIPAGVLFASRNTANLTFAADSSSGAAGQGINISAYGGSQWYRGLTYNNKSGTPDLILQQDGGNVGIGNTAPAEKLVVNGLTRLGGNVVITSAGTQCKIDFGSATQTQWTDLILKTDTGTGEIFRGGSGYSSYTGTAGLNIFNSNGAAGHIGFFPGGTSSPVLLAAANGNVGIGDSSPSTRFRVSGGRSVFAANSEFYSIAVQHNSGGVGQFYIGATNSASPDMLISQTGGTEVLRIGDNGGLSLNTGVSYNNNFLINGYASMIRMYSGADAVFGHNVYGDPNSRVLKQVNTGYYASWIRMYYNQGIYFGTRNVAGTVGDTVSDPAGTTNDKMVLDIDGRLMLNTTTANTTANTILTVKGFTSNTSAFMIEGRDSNGILRTAITDRGAQNWYIMAGDGLEKGSIRYSTPGGFVGILYFDSSGLSRSDFRHVANGGFTWHAHALGTVPPELMRLDNTGNLTIVGTLTESSSITLKENLDPIQDALGAITSLTGYVYDRKDGTAKRRAGLIAEEVETILPNVVKKDNDGNPTGIQYTNLIAYLVESIKELKAEIDLLKGR
jgi:hypothetical protein